MFPSSQEGFVASRAPRESSAVSDPPRGAPSGKSLSPANPALWPCGRYRGVRPYHNAPSTKFYFLQSRRLARVTSKSSLFFCFALGRRSQQPDREVRGCTASCLSIPTTAFLFEANLACGVIPSMHAACRMAVHMNRMLPQPTQAAKFPYPLKQLKYGPAEHIGTA